MEFEDNNKLFVFDKKEVILIFVFVLVIIITSFTLGVRIGKDLSLKADGYTQADIQKTVNLKSVEEENADAIIESKDLQNDNQSLTDDEAFEVEKKLEELADPERLDSEFSQITSEQTNVDSQVDSQYDQKTPLEEQLPSDLNNTTGQFEKEEQIKNVNKEMINDLSPKDANLFKGKYTINLASKKTRALAEQFAEPYMASELEVVINKVSTANKGIWYRVGVGVFNTYNDAKDFLEKNPIFFKGKKYWITEIK